MGLHTIKKGLNLPIVGEPEQRIEDAAQPRAVALVASDYVGMKPTMHVAVGDEVRRGQLLLEDKKTPGVRYTSPASGTVLAVHRGARRALQSLVIQLDSGESGGRAESVPFQAFSGRHPKELSGQEVRDLLLESGLWTALRMRPFSRVARPEDKPHAVFVTASDTQPLAGSVDVVMSGRESDFERGLHAVAALTEGTVYVCTNAGSAVKTPAEPKFQHEEFRGPHPAGTVGLHIHLLDPVDRNKIVWHVHYQDVIAIGRLFQSGDLNMERVISLAGPAVERPRLLRTRLGASTDDLTRGEATDGETRIVSGSVLSGRTAAGEVFGYLGRYHHQISMLPEERHREFVGWLSPGLNRYSTVNTYVSKLIPGKKFRFTTSNNGSHRAMVPIGMYERVVPIDVLPTFLLRALLVGDIEKAEELGCLELDEEDLSLCSFVCPSKVEYGPLLRQVLTIIEKEG